MTTQPGEAGIEVAAEELGRWLPVNDTEMVAYAVVAAYLSADPVSALRVLLADERARDELKRMVGACLREHAPPSFQGEAEWAARAFAAHFDVDALASGVEGDAGTEGKGR